MTVLGCSGCLNVWVEQTELTRGFNIAEGVATAYQCPNCWELFADLMSMCTHKCEDMWKVMMHMKLDGLYSWSEIYRS